jgi:hypothetical protein
MKFRLWTVVLFGAGFLAAGCSSDTGNPVDTRQILAEDAAVTGQVGACEADLLGKRALQDPSVSLLGHTNYVSFQHMLRTYCSAADAGALELRLALDDHQITVSEVFVGDAVRCVCDMPVSGTVDGLPAGTYHVALVYAVERDGVLGEPEVLLEADVTVGPGSGME